MSMIVKQIRILEQESDYLQRLSYVLEGYKSLLVSINRDADFSYNMDVYNNVMSQYHEANLEYRVAVDEIVKKYFGELDHGGISVEVVFHNHTARAIKEDNHGKCSKGRK